MAPVTPLSTQVSMRNMEVVDDVCRSAFGCGGIDLAAVAILVFFGLLAFLVLAAIVHVSEAASIVDEERTRLAAERDAFDVFARRVATMEVSEATAAMPAAGGIATATATGQDGGLDSVKAAYRDTVMDVDHYDADYGEPLGENLAAELGDGLAYAVVDGRQFTPQLKSALLDASREASRRRSSFLSTLEEEAESLSEAAETIEAIDEEQESIAAAPLSQRSWGGLVRDWNRLGDLTDRCRSSMQERQDRTRSLSASLPSERPDLHEYLYSGLPVTHPVLADVAALSEAIETRRSQVLQAITRRV